LLLGTTNTDKNIAPEIDELLSRLSFYDLPGRSKLLLFRYFDHIHQYARAENLLFEMLEVSDSNEDILAYGTSFYQHLLMKSDAALSADNFSKEKALEGLSQLEKLQN